MERWRRARLRIVQTPDRRELNVPVRASDSSFELGGAAPPAGRYEVEIRVGDSLIAAGEFDLVRP
jgi:hypothetical protein